MNQKIFMETIKDKMKLNNKNIKSRTIKLRIINLIYL